MHEAHPRTGYLWVDVTELFDHFRIARYPTGVSRVILTLADALKADHGKTFADVRLLFWDPALRCALTADDPRLLPLAHFLPQLSTLYAAAGIATTAGNSRLQKALRTSLPRSIRFRLFPSDSGVTLFRQWAKQQGLLLAPVRFGAGDALFVPGSFWLGKYAARLAKQANSARVPVTAFVHDVLLLSHPDWLPRRHSDQFRRGCDRFLPGCTAIICNSMNTRDELRRHVVLPSGLPVFTCRLGDLPSSSPAQRVTPAVAAMTERRYVLFVSTITPRKNHVLLVEAWRRLWRQLGAATPYLLLVGGGAPDPALAAMLQSGQAEAGRIIRLTDIDDDGLAVLYRHAWMTAYPSLAEGYGIPVAEALSHGKICLAAPSGGIREIDNKLIDFIDPADPDSVADAVKAYLRDDDRRRKREAEIKENYNPTDWSETASVVRSVLERTVSGSAMAPASGSARPFAA
jgi:glycosyltransferase involved in cell wall biosynthesis